jgi:hypothetical protein
MLRARTRRRSEMEPPATEPAAPGPEEAMALAERYQAEGDLLGAIDVLTRAVRVQRNGRAERRLVRIRNRAFAYLPAPPAAGPPSVPADAFPDVVNRPPEIACGALTGEVLRSAIHHHGCLLVRGVLDQDQAATAVEGIDRSLRALAATRDGGKDRWYDPLGTPGRNLTKLRDWVQVHGGVWLVDSPPMLFEVLEAYEAAGVLRAVGEWLGERPALSLEKSTLRRMAPLDEPSTWHQDGAFIDDGVRTVNVWVALTDCGAGQAAPGLDVIAKRFTDIYETGAPIAGSDLRAGEDEVGHAVSPDLAGSLSDHPAVSRPSFAAGDALMFDEMMPHRTANSPACTEHRYALESWFFAPSTFPRSYVPVVC